MDIFHVMRRKAKSNEGMGSDGIGEIKGIGVFLYISYAQLKNKPLGNVRNRF